jgi:hypothetical protein
MAKRQNHEITIGGWGRELLDLCSDARLLILNGQTPSDQLGEFTCLANGGRSIIDYIFSSPVFWQVITHFEVIKDGTRYCTMGAVASIVEHRLQLC